MANRGHFTVRPFLMRTRVHFDGDMRQPGKTVEPMLVDGGGLRRIGDDRRHHRGVAGTELPHMQVGQTVAADFDGPKDEVAALTAFCDKAKASSV